MGTSAGQKAVLATAPWYYRAAPDFVRNMLFRDIRILHEDEESLAKKLDGGPTTTSGVLQAIFGTDGIFTIVHPESSLRMCWDIVTAVFVLVLVWLVPFYVGFDTWSSPTMSTFSRVMDVWFLLDLVLNFRTGYVDHGATIMNPKKIAINYFSSW